MPSSGQNCWRPGVLATRWAEAGAEADRTVQEAVIEVEAGHTAWEVATEAATGDTAMAGEVVKGATEREIMRTAMDMGATGVGAEVIEEATRRMGMVTNTAATGAGEVATDVETERIEAATGVAIAVIAGAGMETVREGTGIAEGGDSGEMRRWRRWGEHASNARPRRLCL